MKHRLRVLIAMFVLTAAILACASPIAPGGINDAATIVAQTMEALTSPEAPTVVPLASPAQTGTPLPTSTPNPLPRSLYFLNADSSGLTQVYRLEPDGTTVNQVTFEPSAVNAFDVSPTDGSLAYVSNNQLLLADANGSGRRVLVDGGAVDDNNRFTNSVSSPVWSPDGRTIAFGRGGLNFYTLSNGEINKVLENQIDNSAGFPIVREKYTPDSYSPDGSKLLVGIGYFEAGTLGIYTLSTNTLVKMKREDRGFVCCDAHWVPDSTGLYIASPTIGMIDSGLWYAKAKTGDMVTLLPGAASDGTYNFAEAPQIGRDGQLYFFFNNLPQIPAAGHTPLYMMRSASNGMTGRTQLRPDVLNNINEVLWAPDLSFAVVVFAPTPDDYQGGRADIVYPDDRPNVTLAASAQSLHWGP